jgi:hypothetical protein
MQDGPGDEQHPTKGSSNAQIIEIDTRRVKGRRGHGAGGAGQARGDLEAHEGGAGGRQGRDITLLPMF